MYKTTTKGVKILKRKKRQYLVSQTGQLVELFAGLG